MKVNIRYSVEKDRPAIFDIEQATAHEPFTYVETNKYRKKSNVTVLVAEVDCQVVGYAVYELSPKRIYIMRLAVEPLIQRQGIGSALLNNIIDRLKPERRQSISVTVHEDYLKSHMFLKKFGFVGSVNKNDRSLYDFTYKQEVESVC